MIMDKKENESRKRRPWNKACETKLYSSVERQKVYIYIYVEMGIQGIQTLPDKYVSEE